MIGKIKLEYPLASFYSQNAQIFIIKNKIWGWHKGKWAVVWAQNIIYDFLGLGEILEGYSAESCGEKFPLTQMERIEVLKNKVNIQFCHSQLTVDFAWIFCLGYKI